MNISIMTVNAAPTYIPDVPTIHGPVTDRGTQSYYVWTNPKVGWSKLVAGDTIKLPTGSGMLSAHNGQAYIVNNEHIHSQTAPTTDWVAEHNFGRRPAYHTIESDDKIIDCTIRHDTQYTSASFAVPRSGTLTLGF
jgi:hypothetical protein